MFKFDYVPAEQLRSNVQLSPGRGQFAITGWTDKDKDGMTMRSQAGDPKINLILMVSDCFGQEGRYFDTLTPKTSWKLKSILDAIGCPEWYTASGQIDLNSLIGKSGVCELKPPREGFTKMDIVYLTPKQAEKAYIQPAQPATVTHTPMPNNAYEPVRQNNAPSAAQMAEYDELPF